MANAKLVVECTDLDSFRYGLKDLPKILRERFIAEGGDLTTARYVQTNGRWAYVGELKPCYDLSDMD